MISDNDIKKLIDAQKKTFVTKEEFEGLIDIVATKEDLNAFATKEDVASFKDEILTGQDEIFKKLDTLLQEKTVGDEQDKKEKKILAIHNKALAKHNILSVKDSQEVAKLNFF